MNETRMTRAERRQTVLEAGARKLASGNFMWSAGVTYEWLSEETGIDLARISKDFGRREKFSDDLAAFCLKPPQGVDLFLNQIQLMCKDTSLTFEELIVSIGKFSYATHSADPALFARKLMFTVSIYDDSVQKLMAKEYGVWADWLGDLLTSWLESKRKTGQPVNLTMTAREAILMLMTVIEGSLLLARTQAHSDHDLLFEKTLRAVLSGITVPAQNTEPNQITEPA